MIADIRVQGCSLNHPPQFTCTALDQPSWKGHGVLWLALHGLCPWPSRTHDWQFIPELHDWSWGETAPRILAGRLSTPWKSLWWPTTSSFRGIIRGNEIDCIHPISDELITGLHLLGSLGEVLHGEKVPFCPIPSHQLSATYTCSVLSSPTW